MPITDHHAVAHSIADPHPMGFDAPLGTPESTVVARPPASDRAVVGDPAHRRARDRVGRRPRPRRGDRVRRRSVLDAAVSTIYHRLRPHDPRPCDLAETRPRHDLRGDRRDVLGDRADQPLHRPCDRDADRDLVGRRCRRGFQARPLRSGQPARCRHVHRDGMVGLWHWFPGCGPAVAGPPSRSCSPVASCTPSERPASPASGRRCGRRRFSYHEVWHAHTIAAAGLHFGAVYTLAA
jgi:hypothetical protein